MAFISWHNHTEFSNASRGFLDSSNKLEDLIREAKRIGLKGIAITDHEILSGHYQAQQLSRKYNFPVYLGNEIYLMTPEQNNKALNNYQSGITYYPHFLLIALDKEGHYQLRQLSTRAWLRSYYVEGLVRTPTLTTDIEEIVGNNKGHIIASTACLGSYFSHKVLELIKKENEESYNLNNINKTKKDIHKFLQWNKKVFGKDNFFIEIQPGTKLQQAQRLYDKKAIEIAEAEEIKYVVTTDSHYLGKKYRPIHSALLKNKEVEREVDSFYLTAYLMNEEEVKGYLQEYLTEDEINTAINNTMILEKKHNPYDLLHGQIVPTIKPEPFTVQHLFKQYYDKYEYVKRYAYSNIEQDRWLIFKIENVMKKRDKSGWNVVLDRINKELKELYLITNAIKQPLSGYYNTMQKIIDLTWNEGDSLVCPGRGSSGAFEICYLLGITQVDPIPLGDLMPYWRHVSAERGKDLPDYLLCGLIG